jgi:hypothetical protein
MGASGTAIEIVIAQPYRSGIKTFGWRSSRRTDGAIGDLSGRYDAADSTYWSSGNAMRNVDPKSSRAACEAYEQVLVIRPEEIGRHKAEQAAESSSRSGRSHHP